MNWNNYIKGSLIYQFSEIVCSGLNKPLHGHISNTKATQGAEVKVTCENGYHVQGQKENTLTCRSNGTWSAQVQDCQGVSGMVNKCSKSRLENMQYPRMDITVIIIEISVSIWTMVDCRRSRAWTFHRSSENTEFEPKGNSDVDLVTLRHSI